MTGELLTVKEVAARLKVSRTAVQALCKQGKLAYYRIGFDGRGVYRIPTEAFDAYLQSVAVPARTDPSNRK